MRHMIFDNRCGKMRMINVIKLLFYIDDFMLSKINPSIEESSKRVTWVVLYNVFISCLN